MSPLTGNRRPLGRPAQPGVAAHELVRQAAHPALSGALRLREPPVRSAQSPWSACLRAQPQRRRPRSACPGPSPPLPLRSAQGAKAPAPHRPDTGAQGSAFPPNLADGCDTEGHGGAPLPAHPPRGPPAPASGPDSSCGRRAQGSAHSPGQRLSSSEKLHGQVPGGPSDGPGHSRAGVPGPQAADRHQPC